MDEICILIFFFFFNYGTLYVNVIFRIGRFSCDPKEFAFSFFSTLYDFINEQPPVSFFRRASFPPFRGEDI